MFVGYTGSISLGQVWPDVGKNVDKICFAVTTGSVSLFQIIYFK